MSKEVKFGFIEDNNNKIKFVKIPKKYYKYIEDREQVCFENMKKLEEKLEFKKDCEIKAITIQATTVLQEKEKDFKSKIAVLEKALELAVSQLDDAKDMLRECGKRDWAGMLDTSVDYFKARAKEMKDE